MGEIEIQVNKRENRDSIKCRKQKDTENVGNIYIERERERERESACV